MSIQVRNLTHVYAEGLPHESKALDKVNFDVYDGELIGIIGHTGSGKSTLLQTLDGLIEPKEGEINIGGAVITDSNTSKKEVRRKIGLVFQYPEYQLFEETVALDVAFGPKNLGLDQQEIDFRVKEAIEMVGLDYEFVKDRSPFELSGGQKRRVAIAGVIAMKPEVLILDEPTAGLDPKSHESILEMVKEVHKKEDNITIFVSHNMRDVAIMCDKIMVMDGGKLLMMDTPINVFKHRDRLKEIGLSVPPVTEFMNLLKENSIDIKTDILTLDEAEEELYNYLRRK